MAEARNVLGADYDALRRDLKEVLSKQCAEGRFAWVTEETDQSRTVRFFSDLVRSIADILSTACPRNDPGAHAAVLADAVVLASQLRKLSDKKAAL